MQLSRISRQLPANFYGPALTGTDAKNFVHKSKFNSYHFQSDLPRLPIPTVENTLSRYINSLEAQEGSVSSAQIENVKSLAVSEKSKIDNLHQKLLDYDKENNHTSYISGAWFDMYLKDRSALPFNVTPFFGAKYPENVDASLAKEEQMILRAANVVISTVRLCLTLDNEYLEPELFKIGKVDESTREMYRNITNYTPALPHFTPPGNSVPLGLKSVLAYALLKQAPLDMSQYKNLFKSSRIPKAGKDEILKTDKSKHIMIQCRGRFYQLNVLNDNHDILGFEEIYKGVECIWNDACGKEYNEESSVAWLSSWTRDEWANAREHLVSTSSQNHSSISAIDSSIFNLVLDDSVEERLEFNPKDARRATDTFLSGNGATRWWDKSISWIMTKGGDLAMTFEHSWGDGVAVMRCFNDVLDENFNRPMLEKPASGDTTPVPWTELTFEIDETTQTNINQAKQLYKKTFDDLDVSAEILYSVGKTFFKNNKLSPDSVVQLAIQAAWQNVTNSTCPVYQSASTSGFKHGRTENLRACTNESVKAARMISGKVGVFSDAEIIAAIRESGTKHNGLKGEAVMGQGFDRHIFGMCARANEHGLEVPEIFSNDVNKYMNHFNLSTSTLDTPNFISGGFGAVVPDGLGVGYAAQADYMACAITARKSTMKCSPSDFTAAFDESLGKIRDVFDRSNQEKAYFAGERNFVIDNKGSK